MSNWAKLQGDTVGLPLFKKAKQGVFKGVGIGASAPILTILYTVEASGKPHHYYSQL